MLRGDFYNLINSENYDLVKKIESLGHKISLHYDIEIYTDPKKELIAEIKIFEDFLIQKLILSVFTDLAKIFLKIQIIILMFQIHMRINILNKYHTLQTQEDDLDLGTPESPDYKLNHNIQLLTHPIWWTSNLSSVDDILNQLIKRRKSELKLLLGKNVKTFRK